MANKTLTQIHDGLTSLQRKRLYMLLEDILHMKPLLLTPEQKIFYIYVVCKSIEDNL